jgi:hypothetical protein
VLFIWRKKLLMAHTFGLVPGGILRAVSLLSMLLVGGACGPAELPSDPTATPTHSPATDLSRGPSFSGGSTTTGIVYASFDLDNYLLGSPYNGSVRLPGPGNIIGVLAGAQAKGARVIVKLGNHDSYTKNSDGTFSLTKWKAQVDRFKSVSLGSYISDGTLMGHSVIDEPYDPTNWGGSKIPQATVEEMARYSKELWPDLTTFVRAPPDYLAATGIKFKYLDAGWAMYEYSKSRADVRNWIRNQVAAAKKAGIGLIVGLNVLNGGSEASGIRGPHPRFIKYSMSASQLRSWGSALLEESNACGFFNWKYESKYNGRPDIQSAMDYLAQMARSRPQTSCRQGQLSIDSTPAVPIDSTVRPSSDSTVVVPADSTTTPPSDSTVAAPGDSVAAPGDSATTPPGDSVVAGQGTLPDRLTGTGIVFAVHGVDNSVLGSTYGGSVRQPGPRDILSLLAGARARGGRLIVKLGNSDKSTQNSDGTFSLTKWKAQVDRFKGVDLDSYITDGTLMGHALINGPEDRSNWGGKKIQQSTLEDMARYSKQLWPDMTTFVRAPPSYLAATGIKFKDLDAGEAMYQSSQGDVSRWISSQVAAAKRANIGVIVGLNVLNGGTKASRIQGTKKTLYSMSASQLRSWGSTLLNQSYACGFFSWTYSSSYFGRSDIRDAMSYLSQQARTHAKTPCRQ